MAKLGDNIDRLYEIKGKKVELTKQLRELESEEVSLEQAVLEQLEDIGLSSAKSDTASATISSSIHPQVDDWDAVYNHIAGEILRIKDEQEFQQMLSGIFCLLERRVSATIFRDALQIGEKIPGINPYTKTKLSLRKL